MGKYIFLDRDGTIIIDKNYLKDPAGVEFLPHAVTGLKKLQDAGYGLIMITNQSGIGRGYFTEDDLAAVHRRLQEMLFAEGIALAAIYHCPHAPTDNCNCRKPRTGMLEAAAKDFPVDKTAAIMIGDKSGDVKLGKAFGIRSIHVTNGVEAPIPEADFAANDLLEAAEWILKGDNQ